MPVATVSVVPIRRDLVSAPPDGWIEIRRMPFGKKLTRQESAIESGMKGSAKAAKSDEAEMFMKMIRRRITEMDFAECIVDHNLTDPNGHKLNLKDPATLDVLDPRVGEEIEKYIDELNNLEGEEEVAANLKTESLPELPSDGTP